MLCRITVWSQIRIIRSYRRIVNIGTAFSQSTTFFSSAASDEELSFIRYMRLTKPQHCSIKLSLQWNFGKKITLLPFVRLGYSESVSSEYVLLPGCLWSASALVFCCPWVVWAGRWRRLRGMFASEYCAHRHTHPQLLLITKKLELQTFYFDSVHSN
jgi:hypothetical protein